MTYAVSRIFLFFDHAIVNAYIYCGKKSNENIWPQPFYEKLAGHL
jgi:hypothetical protein